MTLSVFYSLLIWLTGDFWGSCWDWREERCCHRWPNYSRWPLSPNRFELQCKSICLASYVSEYGHELFMHLSWSGFCDFEMDFCGWVNSPPVDFQSRVDWDWLSGESEGQLVPKWDHTTNTDLGMSPLRKIDFLNKVVFPYFNMPLALSIFSDHI